MAKSWECDSCTFFTLVGEKGSDHEADHKGHTMVEWDEEEPDEDFQVEFPVESP